ncbi:hypothetical protein MMIC_P0892 [Mariprofundus micogutta]|uniref:Esterase YqiA n=1 Tax=Mariprofundus micogutta TaxID=1921010 RepID=A0A1L8CM00_9PROT|nr:YqiA/YcfP family alpha/beta fold hydrolase [Mariprofundus micogutta]GAV19931.1 hypothetical protein MMIC_P0892 [Mariprofundus micogutta]
MLIFIHGFNSAGNSDKAYRLIKAFPDRSVLTPDCPYAPADAITDLCTLIESGLESHSSVTVIGSSLGGFYAVYLAHKYKLASILINPLVDQTLLRQQIGPQRNYYTDEQYEWTTEHCDQLDSMRVSATKLAIKPLLLLDEQDELLDSRMAAEHFDGLAEIHCFDGGSHRFEHMDEALPIMSNYIGRHGRQRT